MTRLPRLALAALLLGTAAGLAPGLALAQTGDNQPPRARWQELTPEQRDARREQARQRWEQMTPEQRSEARARHDARRDVGDSRRELGQERRQPGDTTGEANARRDLPRDQRQLRRERRDGVN
jgi:Spy/CpxP family protein refolding chaperone